MATTTTSSQLTDTDINQVAKLRGFVSSQQELIDSILNCGISWITTHDYHLNHPNCIQWSKQNVISIIHGPFITIIDMKLLYHARPLDSVKHECKNDTLTGLNGKLSQIHCVPHINPNYLDINQAKQSLTKQLKSKSPSTSSLSSTTSPSPPQKRIIPSCLDSISSISTPIFINARWCPYPPSFFVQFGLLAVVQSNHLVIIYGIPSFTKYHMSNTVINARWTSILNLTKYLQPLQLKNDSKFLQFYDEKEIVLHPTCITWFEQNESDHDRQHLMIGTREGFFILFRLTFKYDEELHNTKSNSVSPEIDNYDSNDSNNNGGFKVEILGEFHCLNGINKQKKKRRRKQTLKMNDMVITQIESIQFKEEMFVAIALENGLCQIWKNTKDNDGFSRFECMKQIDLKSNGNISCLSWYRSKQDDHTIYCLIAKQRIIDILEIRVPHKRLLFEQYSSSNWMNNKTSMYYPKMAISDIQCLNINGQSIIISSSYDGSIHAWTMPYCTPIIKMADNKDNDTMDNKLKTIMNKSSDIYNKLIIDVCHKICNKLQLEMQEISEELNLTPKGMTNFGIASDPNGLLLALIHPFPKRSKTRLSQGLQKLHLYPVTTDHDTMYRLLFDKQSKLSQHEYLQPTSIAIAMDYFKSYHIHLVKEFISYYKTTFSQWFIVEYDGDDEEDDDMDDNEWSVNMNEILQKENSLRFCLLMMRYFISRIEPFNGMQNNRQLEWFNLNIIYIMETLLQLHCYKTFKQLLTVTNISSNEEDEDNDIDMKTEANEENEEFKFQPPSNENNENETTEDEPNKEDQYLSVYLMFVWMGFSYMSNNDKNHLTKLYNFLHKTLLIQLEQVFTKLNDKNNYQKCFQLHKCLYPDDFDDDEMESESDEDKRFTLNYDKVEHCPICNKLTTVVMHNGTCGSDQDTDRHLISRCCVSFRIVTDYNQLYCSCCNGGITAKITKKLMYELSKEYNNDNVMTKCFSNHCKPFICPICNVPLVQLL